MSGIEYEPIIKDHEWREIPDPVTIDSIEEIDSFLVEWSNRPGEYQRHLGLFQNKDGEKATWTTTDPMLDKLLERRNELMTAN